MSVPRARELRKDPTDAERVLWRHLRRRQLGQVKFRRQAPIGRYVVDFVCFERKLIVEVDGGEYAGDAGRDAARSAWLESQGFRLLRFWDHQVLTETEQVTLAIAKALGVEG